MGWIFNGVETKDEERKYSDRELIRRSINRLAPYKREIAISSAATVALTIISLAGPIIFGTMIEKLGVVNIPESATGWIIFLGVIYLLLFVSSWIGDYIINIQVAKMVPYFMVTLRGDIFDALQKQDMKFFDKHRSGKLNSRVSSDAADYGGAVSIVMTVLGQFLIILFVFIVLFAINPPLALLASLVIPILAIASFIFRKVARSTSMAFRKVHASVNAAMAESVNGIQVSKSFGVESESLEDFRKINKQHYRAGFRRTASMMLFFPFVNLLSALSVVAILFVGGEAALSGQGLITAAYLYIFIRYLNNFFFPITQLINFYAQIQAGFAAYERILQVIDTEPSVQDLGNIEKESIIGEIEFQNVDFSYVEEAPVLTNFSLKIKPGEQLAIVGQTGAGKTSIISLLTRFYEFQNGKILIDGTHIRDFKLKSYRQHLGIVLQTPFLFNGTILENITYGRKNASKEDLRQALRISRVEEILEYLKDGLDTPVGEGGSLLSTGQRQLISFARALLADPKILILDEATSSVDAYTESIIQESLEQLLKGRTSIVIAHRLSTVKNADRIIVIDHGKIIEEGSHDALLAQGGEYSTLYNTYFKHQEVDWSPEDISEIPQAQITYNP
ncbi:MAG: ABC transporter ATP-binding protein [Candidatus Hodarchaeales archaeon]|jgi:ABC-type multidrug transport system fused ATPase/permease subunit